MPRATEVERFEDAVRGAIAVRGLEQLAICPLKYLFDFKGFLASIGRINTLIYPNLQ